MRLAGRHLRAAALLLVAGVLLLGPAACGDARSDGPPVIRVTLREFSVAVSPSSLVAGTAYRLRVENRGQVNHELRLRPIGPHDVRDEIASVDQMTLQPGAVTTIDVLLPAATAGSGVELVCLLPSHYEFGMRQTVAVRPTRPPLRLLVPWAGRRADHDPPV